MPDATPDIRQQIDELAVIAAHPAVKAILAQIAAAPPQDRLATAERVASVDALRAQGVNIPAGLRITTRYFENPRAVARADVMINPTADSVVPSGTPVPSGTLCVSVGEIICLTYGRDLQ